MRPYIAVFNVRDEDIENARLAFCGKFGNRVYKKEIKPFLGKGVMSVFKSDPTYRTVFWVYKLASFVNRRLGESNAYNELMYQRNSTKVRK